MPNYSQKFAMRCTENEWRTATINGQALGGRLLAIGYDLSELNFYPNKPYVATNYKDIQSKISSTNTPFKSDRKVIEEWNPDLFYALCCQKEGHVISVDEFFTDKKGRVYQCNQHQGNHIGYYPDNEAILKSLVHKSTFEELLGFYFERALVTENAKELSPAEVIFEGIKSVAGNFFDKSVGADLEGITSEDIDSLVMEGSAHGEYIENGNTYVDAVFEKGRSGSPVFIDHTKSKECKTCIKKQSESFIKTGQIQSIDVNTNIDLSAIINQRTPGPMTFKEILNWFGEGNSIVVGTVSDEEIKCTPHQIESISRDFVELSDREKPVVFSEIFRSKHDFLTYALTKI